MRIYDKPSIKASPEYGIASVLGGVTMRMLKAFASGTLKGDDLDMIILGNGIHNNYFIIHLKNCLNFTNVVCIIKKNNRCKQKKGR